MAQDITPEQYRMALMLVRNVAIVLADLPLEKCLSVASLASSLCPITDPSLWIAKHKDLEIDVEFMQAGLALGVLGRKLKDQMDEEG